VERAEDQEVLQFILETLETVPHLEAALLIWQNQSTEWTADLLAHRIYVSSAMGRSILEDLTRQGMLRKSQPRSPLYMYDPIWDAERGMLPRVAELYRRQLVQVTKLIHSKGSSSVREFARAFQIKKEQ
jgi:predicted ArsR family transcriptional regulator